MNIAIIGAGASGLFLANLLEKLNIKYTLFNKGKVGSKILASGNGRCNISNTNINGDKYHNNKLAISIINNNKNDLFKFFNEFKIYLKEDNEGRLYPISESSESILNILTKNIKNIIDLEVTKITKKNDYYLINDYDDKFSHIVISTGSPSGMKNPKSFDLFKSLNINLNEFKPSLVGFKIKEKIKEISGVRSKASVSLLNNNKLIHEESGEVIFKDDGISGICVMNLSSYYNYLDNKNNTKIIIKLLDKEYDNYESVLNPKLLKFINKNKLNYQKMEFNILNTYSLEFSQVSKGGVDINLVNDNLRLKNDNNIFITGEVLDVDGLCGGYNLSFAFMSAIEVYKEIKNEISNR